MALLRMSAVRAETGHSSRTGVYNAIQAGLFTKPVKIGRRCSAWPDYEIAAINAARIAGKSDDEIRALVSNLHAKRASAFKDVGL